MVQWLKLTSDETVLQAISGYKIPFCSRVYQSQPPSEPCLNNAILPDYETEIKHLRDKGAISACNQSEGQFISSYFLIDKPTGGKRFILNLKKLNDFMVAPHFKLEDWKTVTQIVSRNAFLASVDLEDAYFLIPIHRNFKKFLRFSFREQLYEFNCLPFGLSVAPYIFTRVMKPVIKELRSRGWQSVIYLDDILLMGDSVSICKGNIADTTSLLQSLGFNINGKKSQLEPSRICKFLGFIIDTQCFCMRLPEEKRDKIRSSAKSLRTKPMVKIAVLAQFIGYLVAACPAVQYGMVYTKQLERRKVLALRKHNANYEQKVHIDVCIHEDLDWWINNIDRANNPIREGKYVLEIFSDASLSGWGISCGGNYSHGWWSVEEKQDHINLLELKAAFYGLKCFAFALKSAEILLRIDNSTAISYINKMGSIRYQKLTKLSREIWQWCQDRNLWIRATYIKSSRNVQADRESRIISEETEWELADYAFKEIVLCFGKPHIDLFATNINKKCQIFYSWFPDPEASAVDAFTVDWSCLKFYAFPPFALILKVIRKIINDQAEGVLVVPNWPSRPWFPLFNELLISQPIYLNRDILLLHSPFREFHPAWKSLTLIAGKLSGKHLLRKEHRMNRCNSF